MDDLQQPKLDLKLSEPIKSEDGNIVFQQGIIFRKFSKFAAGTPDDVVMPIQIFYDATSGRVMESMLPAELRDEYKDVFVGK